jgi:hypothetical protein
MLRLKAIMLAAASFLCAPSLQAADAEGNMDFVLRDGIIFAQGDMSADLPDRLNKFLEEQGQLDKTWNVPMVLSSGGGNLGAGLQAGRMIRAHGISTIVVDICASACTSMFMGGNNRLVVKDAQFGVHQFYSPDAQKKPDEKVFSANDAINDQLVVSELLEYMSEMGIDPRLLAIQSRGMPGGMIFLERQQLVDLNIDNVPSANPLGQDASDISIPGVFGDGRSSTVLTGLNQSGGLKPLEAAASEGVVRRFVAAKGKDPGEMTRDIAAIFAPNVEMDGTVVSNEAAVQKMTKFAEAWPFREAIVVPASVTTVCAEDRSRCIVKGMLRSRLGVTFGGVMSETAFNFAYEVITPIGNPRIASEQLTRVE